MGEDAFWAEFEQLIKFPMVVYNREPTVERTIDFIAKFTTSLSSRRGAEIGEQQESEAECNPLLQRLFDFLLQVGLLQFMLHRSSILLSSMPRHVFVTVVGREAHCLFTSNSPVSSWGDPVPLMAHSYCWPCPTDEPVPLTAQSQCWCCPPDGPFTVLTLSHCWPVHSADPVP